MKAKEAAAVAVELKKYPQTKGRGAPNETTGDKKGKRSGAGPRGESASSRTTGTERNGEFRGGAWGRSGAAAPNRKRVSHGSWAKKPKKESDTVWIIS